MTITRTRARVDKLQVGVSRRRNVEGCIADRVLTKVTVKQTTGLLGKYGKDNLRIEHDIVGGDTPYPRIRATPKSSDRYVVVKHGLSGVVTEEDYANEEQPFDARADMTNDLTDKIKLGREYALSSVLTDTSTITNNVTLSGTDQYDDYANSDPLGDWAVARKSVYDNGGKIVEMPGGFAICPWQVYNVLKFHPDLLDTIKYVKNAKKGLDFEEMAGVMGVDRLLVPWCQYNSAKEGQTDVITSVWGNNIVFGYAPERGSKKIETLGFDVKQRDETRVFVNPVGNPPNADEIMVDISYDDLITEVGCAYLIKDAI